MSPLTALSALSLALFVQATNPAHARSSDRTPTVPPSHEFDVAALDGVGRHPVADTLRSMSAWGASAATTAEAAPANLRADVYSRRSLELFWDRPAAGIETRYEIHRAGELAGVKDGTSFYETDLEPGRTYRYEVARVPSDGGPRSATASIEVSTTGGVTPPPGPEAAPADLRADVYSRRSLELFWDRPAAGIETRYEIRRDDELAGVKDGTSFFETNLEPGRTYRYEVARVPSDGGPRSATASIEVSTTGGGLTPPVDGPAAPEGLRAELYSVSNGELFWTRPSGPALLYEVSRNGLVLVTTNGVSYYDDTLESGRSYAYAVVAIDSTGRRSSASEVVLETPGYPPYDGDPGTDGQMPPGTLTRLLPDRDTVFGEDIDTFPEPSRTRPLYLPDLPEERVELLWEYAVVDDQLVNASFEAPLPHRRMWSAYTLLVPAEWRATLRRVAFYVEQEWMWVDARVHQTEVGGETVLVLGIDESVTFPPDEGGMFDSWLYTLFVHETAHVIEQVDADSVSGPLRWCFYGGRCPAGQSYRERFMAEFWPDDLVASWEEIIDEVRDEFQDRSVWYPFREVIYPRFPELFVSSYAATNTNEDLAESFRMFVEEAEVPELGDYDGAAKVRWLWEQPALVLLREQLRAAGGL